MDEASGKVQKASTHTSGIGVDTAAGERDCATATEVDTTSRLPNNKARQQKRASIGAMGWFHVVGSGQLTYCEHTREPSIARQ